MSRAGRGKPGSFILAKNSATINLIGSTARDADSDTMILSSDPATRVSSLRRAIADDGPRVMMSIVGRLR